MRLLTKAEACRELAVSLSTMDRRIASGEIEVRREPRGRRHRIYVVLDDDLPENGANIGSAGYVAGRGPGADSGVGGAGGIPPEAT